MERMKIDSLKLLYIKNAITPRWPWQKGLWRNMLIFLKMKTYNGLFRRTSSQYDYNKEEKRRMPPWAGRIHI